MKKLITTVLASFFFLSTEAQRIKVPDLLIQNINIVDVEKGEIVEGMDVFILRDRIYEIVDSKTLDLEANFTLDGTGKYLIPGLWDMHAHPDDPEMWKMKPRKESRDLLLPLFVLHGVTGIRDMGGSLRVVNEWRENIANGSILGPTIFAAGPIIDGPKSRLEGVVRFSSPKQAPQKVDSLIEAGVDFLKIHSSLPKSTYFALSEYAQSIDFPFCGYLPQSVTNEEASDSGINSLEHLLNIPLECSSVESDVRNRTVDYGGIEDRLGKYIFRNKLIIDSYDSEKADALFKTFVENGTWLTPTISRWYKNAWFESEEIKDQAYFKYLPTYMRKYWNPQYNDHLKFRQQEFLNANQLLVEHYIKIIGDMNDAGVRLLAGTDTGANPLCWPGLGVHYEIELFEKAGLTPIGALRTATLNPVLYFGIEEDYGTIEKGKFADMVVLDANPLETVSNTQKISGVVKSGMVFNKNRIKEYLSEIADRQ